LWQASSSPPTAHALDLNAFRRAHHLPPLHQSAALNSAARRHAADMARRNSLDHDGFYQRMDGYSRAAENVAYGCSNADCAYRLWAKPSGHRRNMLMAGLTHYGLASARAANGRVYWVLELAGERPRPALMRSAAPHRHAKKRSHRRTGASKYSYRTIDLSEKLTIILPILLN
jgi:hypothetical protein